MVLWRSDLASFSVLKEADQCIIRDLNVFNKGVWMIATIYGHKEVIKRRELWGSLHEVSNRKIPFIVGGDFNCILSQEDKRGGRKFVFSQGPKEMADFLNVNDLHDVGFVGPRFTWCNNKSGGERILERLDSCLLNSIAINGVQVAVVRHLARVASDHCSIVLKIFNNSYKRNGMLKFEDFWISYKASSFIIARVWRKVYQGSDMEILNKKCKKELKELFYWSKARIRDFSFEKEKLKEEIS
ncbi:threonine dehydratase [Dendrobium catenatum]|uniref:Threonine dehydratase n=1 Tax=Dendrobium catenatum TaxID=906689 RepID=A0A2I0XFL2_9ASPA|nr:threonine dehydratase [Dendrobium catenatum]